MNDIRYHAKLAQAEHKLLAQELSEMINRNGVAEKRELSVRIDELQLRLSIIDKNIKSLYEDKCAGKLPENVFDSLMASYIDEQKEISSKKTALEESIAKYQKADDGIEKWLELVERYKDIKQLTRAIVCLLIDHIEIGCVPEQTDGVQEIKIYYRFIGNLLNEK